MTISQDGIILGAVLVGAGDGSYRGLWRDPDVPSEASTDIDWYAEQARQAEAAQFHFVFIVDSQFIDETFPPHHLNRLEPLTLLSAVATRTERIGLAATISSTYAEPWDIARRLASLDVLSDGRAAWNIVTSMDPGTAGNFGRPAHLDGPTRYRRAAEAVRVVRRLWDSYEDDAFPRGRDTGEFLDPTRLHAVHLHGEFFDVAGPLNIQRSRQGQPVLIQAGTSEQGRQLSAEVAEIVFSLATTIAQARDLAEDVRERARHVGRDLSTFRFGPALSVSIGDSDEEVLALIRARRAATDDISAAARRALGNVAVDEAQLDAPAADLLRSHADVLTSMTARDFAVAAARGLTLRQWLNTQQAHWAHFCGAPHDIADEIQAWVESGAVDGFNLFVHEPQQYRRFCGEVVPILRARGLVRDRRANETLRESLGLPFPENIHTVTRREGVTS